MKKGAPKTFVKLGLRCYTPPPQIHKSLLRSFSSEKRPLAPWWAEELLDLLDPARHIIGVRGTVSLVALDKARASIIWESGLPPENPNAAAVNAGLEAYYPTRIGHLRQTLGLA